MSYFAPLRPPLGPPPPPGMGTLRCRSKFASFMIDEIQCKNGYTIGEVLAGPRRLANMRPLQIASCV